jgi:5-methylcytosine-specific restriction protein A
MHSAEATLEPGRFAAPLLNTLSGSSEQGLISFKAFSEGLVKNGIRVSMKVNGLDLPFDGLITSWPETISQFEIRLSKKNIEFDRSVEGDVLNLADSLVVPVFGMMAALLGTEETEASLQGEKEGAEYQTLVTRYERSRTNREACIRFHGAVCKACGFNFHVFYGAAAGNYIEVHHSDSIADYGRERIVDPINDLVPLCSNCHSVAHKRRPPFTVGAISGRIEEARHKGLS